MRTWFLVPVILKSRCFLIKALLAVPYLPFKAGNLNQWYSHVLLRAPLQCSSLGSCWESCSSPARWIFLCIRASDLLSRTRSSCVMQGGLHICQSSKAHPSSPHHTVFIKHTGCLQDTLNVQGWEAVTVLLLLYGGILICKSMSSLGGYVSYSIAGGSILWLLLSELFYREKHLVGVFKVAGWIMAMAFLIYCPLYICHLSSGSAK